MNTKTKPTIEIKVKHDWSSICDQLSELSKAKIERIARSVGVRVSSRKAHTVVDLDDHIIQRRMKVSVNIG